MNTITLRISKKYRGIYYVQKMFRLPIKCLYTTATIDPLDSFTPEILHRQKNQIKATLTDFSVRNFMKSDSSSYKDISEMTLEELDAFLLQLLNKNRDTEITKLLADCSNFNKNISNNILKIVVRHYSTEGRPDMIVNIQKYYEKVDPSGFKRNGEFIHYLAKAQCMKGNTEKGLSVLKDLYEKNRGLRNFYRIVFRELIQDTVLNRSEASLVMIKQYVLEFSEKWNDNYPLVCLWHNCWSSTWFSDQMLANELLETSTALQDIVSEEATAFSISILIKEYNEDAVVRLLQCLLKYDKMKEYAKVLQVLFNYKIRNKDVRGCSEIIRNCEALGIQLTSNQHGKYINMIIGDRPSNAKRSTKIKSRDFKLKF